MPRAETDTTLRGIVGAFERGAAPVAAGAAIGGLAGAPFAGVGAPVGAAFGAASVPALELVDVLYNPLAKHFGWPEAATPQEMTDRVLDAIGVARPTTATERIVEATTGGFAGGASPIKAAENVAEKAASPIVKSVAEELAAQRGLQAASGAAGGAAAQIAGEAGAGPTGQMVAGMVGGGLPYAKGAVASLPSSAVSPGARTAMEAGYKFSPRSIPPLGEGPSRLSATLGAESGKIKLWQDASTRNQSHTNRLAAEDIGLHPDTALIGEQPFDVAKQPAIDVYREVESAIPEVTLAGDAGYRAKAERIGAGKGLAEKFFPQLKGTPEILKLREMLLQNEQVPTSVAMQTVSDLRHQASENFRAVGDAQKHALGAAQRDAANLMEDAIDHSVKNAPLYYAKKFDEALKERHAASADMMRLNMGLTKAAADLSTHSNIYKVAAAMKAGREAERRLGAAQERFNKATETVESWRKRLGTAHTRDEQNRTMLDRYRDARTLFAKIHNVEDATNRTTGNVSASGLARLYNKGAPLSGKIKTIAEAHNTSPKDMQVPELFGHAEDWSVLDALGTTSAIAMGHPAAAIGFLGRHPARRTLLSDRYQRAILAPSQTTGTHLSTLLNPGGTAAILQDQSNTGQ